MSADVTVEVEIHAPVEVVWRLLVEPAELVRWLGVSATLEPRPDGRFRFELFPGQFCSGRYLEVVPHRRVALTWGWEDPAIPVPPGSTIVAIDLTAAGPSLTLLRLTHSGLAEAMRPLHDDGWRRYTARLAAVAEGREAPADPSLPYQGPDALPNPLARGDAR
jgi:uncharacterized protein YndB with AHSA1/START domain